MSSEFEGESDDVPEPPLSAEDNNETLRPATRASGMAGDRDQGRDALIRPWELIDDFSRKPDEADLKIPVDADILESFNREGDRPVENGPIQRAEAQPEVSRVAEGAASSDVPPKQSEHGFEHASEIPGYQAAEKAFFDNQERRCVEGIEEVLDRFRMAREELAESLDADGKAMMEAFSKDLKLQCDFLRLQVRMLRVGTNTQRMQAAMATVLLYNALKQDLEDFYAKLKEHMATAAQAAAEGFVKWLMRALGKVGRRIMNLVAGLLTPKEWTLKGELSVVPIFAKAGVEIKFGP